MLLQTMTYAWHTSIVLLLRLCHNMMCSCVVLMWLSALQCQTAKHKRRSMPRTVYVQTMRNMAGNALCYCGDSCIQTGCYRCLGCFLLCLQEQHDIVCILLMININAEHRRLMSKRRVPCLDDYLDRVNLLLWPRYKVGGPHGATFHSA